MFKLSEIKELIKQVDDSSIQELEIEKEGSRLSIKKPNAVNNITPGAVFTQPNIVQAAPEQPAVQQVQATASNAAPASSQTQEEDNSLHNVTSPMVGTFYTSPSPSAPPFVKKGDKVSENTVVCIVEAMKLMNEIEAEVKGEIVDILVENGQLVEFGQPLFLVKT